MTGLANAAPRHCARQAGLCAWLAVLLWLSATGLAQGDALTPRQIADRSTGAVVLLVMQDEHRQTVAMASGFVVAPGVVASCHHVVRHAEYGFAKLVGAKQTFPIAGILVSDSLRDMVLLAVPGVEATPLELADSGRVGVGDRVFVVGNPRGLEGTFSQGIVSSLRRVDADTVLQITAPVSPGSSGGPVLNDEAQVIGVAVATYRGGQNLNFAIPSTYLQALLPLSADSTPKPLSARPRDTSVPAPFFVGQLGEGTPHGVMGSNGMWDLSYYGGGYSFSLRNALQHPVRHVQVLVVFYDESRKPVEVDLVTYTGTIPPGLARRVRSRVDNSVHDILGTGYTEEHKRLTDRQIEFRVLDFELIP